MQIECEIYVAPSSLSSSFDSVSSTVPVSDKARYHAKRNLKQARSGRICVWFILFFIIQRCFELGGYVPLNDKLIMDYEFVENCSSVFFYFIGASARRQCGKLRNKASSQPLNRNSTPGSPEYDTRTIKSWPKPTLNLFKKIKSDTEIFVCLNVKFGVLQWLRCCLCRTVCVCVCVRACVRACHTH
jgi:hypothetical protein